MPKKLAPILILGMLLTAGLWVSPSDVEGLPLCVFKYVTGFDCPGCGLSRSFLSIPRGHLVKAFQYNAAGPLLYLTFLTYLIDRVGHILYKKSPICYPSFLVKIIGVCLVVLLFGHWILKLGVFLIDIS